jgi:hypothetical protein
VQVHGLVQQLLRHGRVRRRQRPQRRAVRERQQRELTLDPHAAAAAARACASRHFHMRAVVQHGRLSHQITGQQSLAAATAVRALRHREGR